MFDWNVIQLQQSRGSRGSGPERRLGAPGEEGEQQQEADIAEDANGRERPVENNGDEPYAEGGRSGGDALRQNGDKYDSARGEGRNARDGHHSRVHNESSRRGALHASQKERAATSLERQAGIDRRIATATEGVGRTVVFLVAVGMTVAPGAERRQPMRLRQMWKRKAAPAFATRPLEQQEAPEIRADSRTILASGSGRPTSGERPTNQMKRGRGAASCGWQVARKERKERLRGLIRSWLLCF
eukprot:scaffold1272_cov250-Pinguiococcus_pyrenoidosus.AAC.17